MTCIDPRVFPEKILGLQIGEAFIFRTVAGRPQAVIQEIIAIDRVSKEFEDLILLYHTGERSRSFENRSHRMLTHSRRLWRYVVHAFLGAG